MSKDELIMFIVLFIIVAFVLVVMLFRFIFLRKSRNWIFYRSIDIDSDDGSSQSSHYIAPNISDFYEYVKKIMNNEITGANNIEQQFESLPDGYFKKCEHGQLEENRHKNIYQYILPYDGTRVILRRRNNRGDYINACYLEGPIKNQCDYIITQNPLKATVDDFWFMIYQENVENIIMVSGSKDNYFTYWPEKHETKHTSDGIELVLAQTHLEKTHIRRIFHLQKGTDVRQIYQYHVTNWNARENPSLTQIVEFLKKVVLQIKHSDSPLVIHCHGGIGRSGTLALCDRTLRESKITDVIDIYGILKRLRSYRANLVNDLDHYKLVHCIILECILSDDDDDNNNDKK